MRECLASHVINAIESAKYKNLKEHCESITNDEIDNETVKTNIKSFELVLYQKIDEENDEVGEAINLFDICPTRNSSKKGFFQKSQFGKGEGKTSSDFLLNDCEKKDNN